MKRISRLTNTIMMVSLLVALPSYAKLGIGLHYGMDFSLKMKDSRNEILSFGTPQSTTQLQDLVKTVPGIDNVLQNSGLTIDTLINKIGADPSKLSTSSPFKFSRSGLTRSKINFGGKVYIDIIPIIDAIELSFNIGAWEYDAVLKYPNGKPKDQISKADIDNFIATGDYEQVIQMDEKHLTLKEFDLPKIFGLDETPYLKMLFDLSIRKNIFAIPKPLKTWKLYVGAGPSLHVGTPVMTAEYVSDKLSSAVKNANNNIVNLNTSITRDLLKSVVNDFIKESKKPIFGIHIILGTMIKLPVIPLGFYVDGKYEIPFGDLDKNAGLKGYGFLLNGGIALAF